MRSTVLGAGDRKMGGGEGRRGEGHRVEEKLGWAVIVENWAPPQSAAIGIEMTQHISALISQA